MQRPRKPVVYTTAEAAEVLGINTTNLRSYLRRRGVNETRGWDCRDVERIARTRPPGPRKPPTTSQSATGNGATELDATEPTTE